MTEAVNGITRWRRRLDYILGALLNRDPATLDAPLRQILRLGLYELAEMRCECPDLRCACGAVRCGAVHGTLCMACLRLWGCRRCCRRHRSSKNPVLPPVLPTVLQPRCTL